MKKALETYGREYVQQALEVVSGEQVNALGLLPRAQEEVLMAASDDGAKVEMVGLDGWADCPEPLWNPACTYRIKPGSYTLPELEAKAASRIDTEDPSLAADVVARAAVLFARTSGYVAENTWQEYTGESVAYGDADFEAAIVELFPEYRKEV